MITIADEGRVFAQSEIFADLPEAKLRQLAFASERFVFRDGDTIIRQGEEGEFGFLILEGEVEGSITMPEGERVLGRVGPGFVLGDGAMLTGSHYQVTATARGPVKTLRIGRNSFLELLDGDKDAMSSLLRNLSARNERVERELSIKFE